MPQQQRQMSDRTLSERRARILARYQPLEGAYDELLTPAGDIRPGWSNFVDAWCGLSTDELNARFGIADRHVRDAGVSYRVHGDMRDPSGSTERAWPLSQVPLVITGAEWQQIAAGVAQRATLAERLIDDIYGPGQLFADGILPGTVVSGSSDYLRPLHNVPVPGGKHLSIYAADLGRGPDGKWWVLGDRTQAPSGSGYALENRLALARAFPDLYRGLNVERLAPFFQSFRAGLVSGATRSDPRICLLTPGPLSESYFEQAYLARYLGFMLVEGADLVMRDDKLHVRTIAGLKRADVVWRRLDGDFIDPLELNANSALGVPGLLQAMRKGTLVVANSPGSGVIESRALMSFMPMLARRLLGEDLLLPNTATWWCGQQAARETVLARLGDMSVAAAFHSLDASQNYDAPVLAADLDEQARDRLAQKIASNGLDLVGQEVVKLSTMPVWQDGGLQARPFTLRVYATATPDGWQVMPGGFCRISGRLDARAVSMGEGVRSADVWVTSDRPVAPVTLLPSSDQPVIRRIFGNLPSRAADNMFWLGRYVERAEMTLRLVRSLIGRLIDADALSKGHAEALGRIGGLLVACGCAPAALRADGAALATAALHDGAQYGSAAASVHEARRTASVIRERLSVDAWRLFGDLQRQLDRLEMPSPSEGEAFETADRALRILAALSGLSQENMTRGAGWRFLDLGRRIERGIGTCRVMRHFSEPAGSAECLDVLLDLTDSQITYRSRYLVGLAAGPVTDLVMLDPYNPRSVGFQVDRIDHEVRTLPTLRDDGMLEEPRRISLKLAADLRSMSAEQIDKTMILATEQALMAISSAIASRYFLQSTTAPQDRMAGLA